MLSFMQNPLAFKILLKPSSDPWSSNLLFWAVRSFGAFARTTFTCVALRYQNLEIWQSTLFMLQVIQMPTLSMKEMSLHPNFIMSERLNNMMNGVGGYERSWENTFNVCAVWVLYRHWQWGVRSERRGSWLLISTETRWRPALDRWPGLRGLHDQAEAQSVNSSCYTNQYPALMN